MSAYSNKPSPPSGPQPKVNANAFILATDSPDLPIHVSNTTPIPVSVSGAPLVTGTLTGTPTSSVMEDSTQTWGVNELDGAMMVITDGVHDNEFRVITSNTATQITLRNAFSFTPNNGDSYQVYVPLPTRLEGDVQIGAVEIKDQDTNLRANVGVDGAQNASYVQSNSLAQNTTLLSTNNLLNTQVAQDSSLTTINTTLTDIRDTSGIKKIIDMVNIDVIANSIGLLDITSFNTTMNTKFVLSDFDTGVGTSNLLGVGMMFASSGGPTAISSTNPLPVISNKLSLDYVNLGSIDNSSMVGLVATDGVDSFSIYGDKGTRSLKVFNMSRPNASEATLDALRKINNSLTANQSVQASFGIEDSSNFYSNHEKLTMRRYIPVWFEGGNLNVRYTTLDSMYPDISGTVDYFTKISGDDSVYFILNNFNVRDIVPVGIGHQWKIGKIDFKDLNGNSTGSVTLVVEQKAVSYSLKIIGTSTTTEVTFDAGTEDTHVCIAINVLNGSNSATAYIGRTDFTAYDYSDLSNYVFNPTGVNIDTTGNTFTHDLVSLSLGGSMYASPPVTDSIWWSNDQIKLYSYDNIFSIDGGGNLSVTSSSLDKDWSENWDGGTVIADKVTTGQSLIIGENTWILLPSPNYVTQGNPISGIDTFEDNMRVINSHEGSLSIKNIFGQFWVGTNSTTSKLYIGYYSRNTANVVVNTSYQVYPTDMFVNKYCTVYSGHDSINGYQDNATRKIISSGNDVNGDYIILDNILPFTVSSTGTSPFDYKDSDRFIIHDNVTDSFTNSNPFTQNTIVALAGTPNTEDINTFLGKNAKHVLINNTSTTGVILVNFSYDGSTWTIDNNRLEPGQSLSLDDTNIDSLQIDSDINSVSYQIIAW